MRVFAFSALCALMFAPAIAAAQPTGTHPSDALPFGRWTVVNDTRDDSTIVWSRCRGADGGPGRWLHVQPLEVVRPTYFVQSDLLNLNAQLTPPLVECLGGDGLPGRPDPALPAPASIPVGSRITYGASVGVEYYDPAQRNSLVYSFTVGGEATAYDDVAGVVIVSTSEIDVFPPTFRLIAGHGYAMMVHRPDTPDAKPATHCTVGFTDEKGGKTVTGEREVGCNALSSGDRERLIAAARATAGNANSRGATLTR